MFMVWLLYMMLMFSIKYVSIKFYSVIFCLSIVRNLRAGNIKWGIESMKRFSGCVYSTLTM